jgi:hypothetical protein
MLRQAFVLEGWGIPRRVHRLVLDEDLTYPWLLHYCLARLPRTLVVRVPALGPAIVDSVVTGTTVAVAWTAGSPQIALLAGVLQATAPALLAVGIGPRPYEVTPRPWGEGFFILGLTAWCAAVATDTWAWAIAGCLTLGLAFLTSKFAAQVTVLAVPVMALVSGQWAVLLAVPLAIATALILSGGRYRSTAYAQIMHLSVYVRYIQWEESSVRARGPLRLLSALGNAVTQPGSARGKLEAIALAFEHDPFFLLLARNPALLLALGLIVSSWFGALVWPLQAAWANLFVAWIVGAFVVFVATNFPVLRVLGESERYLEYAQLPANVLVAAWITGLPNPLPLVGIYVAWVLGFLSYTWFRMRRRSRRDDVAERELHGYLTSQGDLVALPVPGSLAFDLGDNVPTKWVMASDGVVWARQWKQLFASYPYLVPDIEGWKARTGVSVGVVRLAALSDPDCPDYGFEGQPLFENATFAVFPLPGSASASPRS